MTGEGGGRSRRVLVWVLAAVVGVVVLVAGGTWVYINVIRDDPPPPLSLDAATTTSTAPAGASTTTPAGGPDEGAGLDGVWDASGDSVVGYRVDEILFGQNATAVGRTNAVTGSLTLEGGRVTEASFEVDMATVTSDESRRDDQFRGRIMDVATHPTSAFVLTAPIDLGSVPAEGETVSAEATGDLTLRGTTASVTFPVEARLQDGTIQVSGTIPIVFADWGIPNPSGGPVTTEDNGQLELLLVFVQG
ncbi:MAG: YceI family protein [Acidimicrobiales bacterium]|nr:YceI family protein [Acidimicrobiales bacterium]